MTYPFDQFTALANANGQLVLKLADIARASGEQYAQLGGKAAAAFLDQLKEFKPGSVPSFTNEGITGLLGEIETSREESLVKIKSAVDEWQGCCKDVMSQATNQRELTDTVQAWFQPLLKMSVTEPEKVQAPARQTAKAAETA